MSDLEKKLQGIPVFSNVIARSKVALLERKVSRFRVRTTRALGRLAGECGRQTALQASVLAAREAALNLSPTERQPFLDRIAAAERRLDAIRPLCVMPQTECNPSTSGGEIELSGGGEKQ